jgi:hypothetical protein
MKMLHRYAAVIFAIGIMAVAAHGVQGAPVGALSTDPARAARESWGPQEVMRRPKVKTKKRRHVRIKKPPVKINPQPLPPR